MKAIVTYVSKATGKPEKQAILNSLPEAKQEARFAVLEYCNFANEVTHNSEDQHYTSETCPYYVAYGVA